MPSPTNASRVVFYMLCAASLLAVSKTQTGSYGASNTHTIDSYNANSNSNNNIDGKLESMAVVYDGHNEVSSIGDDTVSHSDTSDDIAYEAAQQLGQLTLRLNQLALEEQSRQLGLPNITFNDVVSRIPCTCDKGICSCCAGFLAVIGMNSCTEVVYRPEEFSFELRMKVNNNIWFRRKVSGQNPPPFCFRPPRFGFARACVQFHDIWFVGRNMHVCMFMSGSFQGYQLFERNFDCLLFGEKGVKIVKPEQGFPVRPTDVEIDDGDDDIEDYDENVVRRRNLN